MSQVRAPIRRPAAPLSENIGDLLRNGGHRAPTVFMQTVGRSLTGGFRVLIGAGRGAAAPHRRRQRGEDSRMFGKESSGRPPELPSSTLAADIIMSDGARHRGTDHLRHRLVERASCTRLIEAFRNLRGVPVYSPRAGIFDPFRPIDGLELIAAVQKILGRESPACYQLFQWARMMAEGSSFREYWP